MNLQQAIQKRKEMEAKVLEKAMEDSAFMDKLLTDPKAALTELTGKPIPDSLTVNVVPEAPNTITLVVPALPQQASEDAELSDEALDKVSGGLIGSAVAGVDVIVSVI